MIKMKHCTTEKNQSHHMNQKNHSLDNVPELRFPEFVDDGEWMEKKLKEVCNINPSNTRLPNEFIYIDLESVAAGKLLKRNIINLENAPSRAQRLLENGDIIYQMVRPYQKNNYFFDSCDKHNYVASTGYALLRSYQSKMYLYQYVHSDNFVNRVLSKCTGSNYPAINSSDLSQIKVEIPKPQEQQKIASCLSSLDELITAHSQKLELLKDHKKGLMQNLFPQEGETVPKYRFPEFENDGEWVEEPLSSKVSVIDGDRGLSYPKAHEYSSDGYCVFLSAKNVTKNGFLFNEIQFITKEKDELLRKGKLSRFDIVMTTRGSLGQLAFYNENIQFENIRINSGMVILRPKDNRINPNYLYSYFNSNSIQSAIKSQGFGNAVQQLTVAVINNFTLRYPYTTQEQQKIASCLSAVDELIIAQEEKIEQLRLHKKGLMQGLFPKAV
jgi:type I restriction enzyme S subunit